ncbi:MAG: hypothetical protein ACR2IJ_07255 [Fluviibacter sp.]
MEVLVHIVKLNTDFRMARIFHGMGFALNDCMRGVGWPQNRYELPSALFRPQPVHQNGCIACGKIWSRCRCAFRSQDMEALHYETHAIDYSGIPDENGTLWSFFTQSMEDGYNGETYLICHWSDEWDEWSTATALNGEIAGAQLRSLRSERTRFWRPADPMCFCHQLGDRVEHDAWEACTFQFPFIADEEIDEMLEE